MKNRFWRHQETFRKNDICLHGRTTGALSPVLLCCFWRIWLMSPQLEAVSLGEVCGFSSQLSKTWMLCRKWSNQFHYNEEIYYFITSVYFREWFVFELASYIWKWTFWKPLMRDFKISPLSQNVSAYDIKTGITPEAMPSSFPNFFN